MRLTLLKKRIASNYFCLVELQRRFIARSWQLPLTIDNCNFIHLFPRWDFMLCFAGPCYFLTPGDFFRAANDRDQLIPRYRVERGPILLVHPSICTSENTFEILSSVDSYRRPLFTVHLHKLEAIINTLAGGNRRSYRETTWLVDFTGKIQGKPFSKLDAATSLQIGSPRSPGSVLRVPLCLSSFCPVCSDRRVPRPSFPRPDTARFS